MPAETRIEDLAEAPYSIQDIRTGIVPIGREVRLRGVQATTAAGPLDTEFWIQEPEGGEYSGIRVHIPTERPDLDIQIGDIIRLDAVVSSRASQITLVVEETQQIVITGERGVQPTPVTWVSDWSALVDVLVEIEQARVLDCGDTAGLVSLELPAGAPIVAEPGGSWFGEGQLRGQIRGVVSGTGTQRRLRLREKRDRGDLLENGVGCIESSDDLQRSPRIGWVTLRDHVVTARDGSRLWIQPEGGGRGMQVGLGEGVAPAGLSVGTRLDLQGIVDLSIGPPRLQVRERSNLEITGEAEPVPLRLPGGLPAPDAPEVDWTLLDGSFIELFDVVPLAGTGDRVDTDRGIPIDGQLFAGELPLPEAGNWAAVRGVFRSDLYDQALLPRDEADLVR